MYITICLCNVNKAEPTLALKPRGDVTRNPKQGYQWPQKRTCVSAKKFKKKRISTVNEVHMLALLVKLFGLALPVRLSRSGVVFFLNFN